MRYVVILPTAVCGTLSAKNFSPPSHLALSILMCASKKSDFIYVSLTSVLPIPLAKRRDDKVPFLEQQQAAS